MHTCTHQHVHTHLHTPQHAPVHTPVHADRQTRFPLDTLPRPLKKAHGCTAWRPRQTHQRWGWGRPTPLLTAHAMLHPAPRQAHGRTKARPGHQCREARLSPEGRRIPWDAVGVKLLGLPGCGAHVRHSPHPAHCPGHPGPIHPAGLPAPQAPHALSYGGAGGWAGPGSCRALSRLVSGGLTSSLGSPPRTWAQGTG